MKSWYEARWGLDIPPPGTTFFRGSRALIKRVVPSKTSSLEDAFMEVAWHDFILWAIGDSGVRQQFRTATGLALYSSPKNALEAAIDKAAGADQSQNLEAFVRWATLNLWGIEYAPERYRAEAARLAKATK